MSTLEDLRDIRLEKLNKLKELGVNPYPAHSNRNIENMKIVEDYEELEGREVTAAGRIRSFRKHGKLVFIDIKDQTGAVQLYVKSDALKNPDYKDSGLGFGDIDLLDAGDFIEGTGTVTKTQAGEISVCAESIRLLSKTLRPLPDMRDGLKDKETRLRRRYLDTNMNEDVYKRFVRRAKFWEAHREFFKEHSFLEMNIPVLEHTPGGADANPFITHMDAIDQDFYLRISQELYLKRLIGGGYEKVYEIGPRFRNEGISEEHLPEHIAMEFYWAYADWEDGMNLVKDLFDYVIENVYEGRKKFRTRSFDVDFSKEWEVIDYAEIMRDKYGINLHDASDKEIEKLLEENGVEVDFEMVANRGIDILWKIVRKGIAGPAFLINHPKFISPLSKSKSDDPKVTERFQPIIAGSELGNGWSELNDPLDQLERFKEQQAMRDAGDKEAQFLDIDYVEMLEYGMPPTCGYGHSERVFWYLEDVPAREGVPFPQLKYELDETSKQIYGL